MVQKVYGIWDGERFLKADSGNDFKTDILKNAEEVLKKFQKAGVESLEIKEYPTGG